MHIKGFLQQLLHCWLLKASNNWTKVHLWHSCNVNSQPTVAPEGWAALLMWKIHSSVVSEILTGTKAPIPPPVNTKLINILWLCFTDKYVINAVHLHCVFSFICLYPASGLPFMRNAVENDPDTGNNQIKVLSNLNWIITATRSIVHITMSSNWTVAFHDPFTEQQSYCL